MNRCFISKANNQTTLTTTCVWVVLQYRTVQQSRFNLGYSEIGGFAAQICVQTIKVILFSDKPLDQS